MNITIGIPAFNEEKNIGKVIISLKKIVNDILYVMMVQLILQKKLQKG